MSASTHLLRDLAPIPARAWTTIDDEARERLTPLLAARRRLLPRYRPGHRGRVPPPRRPLCLEETFTFRVLEPDAAITLG